MVDKVEVTVTDLEKNIKVNQDTRTCILWLNMSTWIMEIVDTIGFAIDKENLRILRAKIDAGLIDEDKKQPNNRKPKTDKINIISF